MASKYFCILVAVGLACWQAVWAQVELRVVVNNPSRLVEREVEVKQLLPAGIVREDVLDSGEFEVRYDAEAKRYAVSRRVTLQPEEQRAFVIRLRDIWVFDENELQLLDERAEEIRGKLAGTRFEVEGELLRQRVAKNIQTLLELQRAAAIGKVDIPEHISAFDRNQVRYEIVRDDANALEQMLSIIAGSAILDDRMIGVPLDVAILWKVILVIISFVGALTLAFLVIWTSQLKKIRQAEREAGID